MPSVCAPHSSPRISPFKLYMQTIPSAPTEQIEKFDEKILHCEEQRKVQRLSNVPPVARRVPSGENFTTVTDFV